jgi:hypothetical protein
VRGATPGAGAVRAWVGVYEEHRPPGAPPEPNRTLVWLTLAWLETMMGHGLTADSIGR